MAERDENSYSHILKYTGIFGGVQGLNILIGVVRTKLVALILGPDGMGLISLFNSTIKLLSDSTTFGLSMIGVKDVSEAFESQDEEKLNHAVSTIRGWSLLSAVLGMVLCVVLSPWLSDWTFSWGDHTLHFIFLSPVVALMAIAGGETAILKGVRQLRSLAVISVYTILAVLVLTVPLYYFFGQQAIVPSLFIAALATLVITVKRSWRLYPPKLHIDRRLLADGRKLITLGMAFVLAGIMGSGADFLIRSYLNTRGELYTVGLFNAGYMLTMTYAGMVFTAMEADYFPRLSGLGELGERFNITVNHQMEVTFLMVSPLLVLFMMSLPILLPLLYSTKFLPAASMMHWAILAMYGRALTLPLEYIALARGDSLVYFTLEAFYDVLVVATVIVGFRLWGLEGTGVALFVTTFLSLAVDVLVVCWRYAYKPSSSVLGYFAMQMPIALLAFAASVCLSGWAYWTVGVVLTVLSLTITLVVFHSKTRLWLSLKERWSAHFPLHRKHHG
jgi:O-antigen/teichoic acid export membrane protein